MNERTKNQLKQASSILLLTDFQDFTDFTEYIFFFSFLFYFLLWGTKPLSGRTDGWSIHRCRTLLQDPRKPTQSDFIDVVSTDFLPLRGWLFGRCLR